MFKSKADYAATCETLLGRDLEPWEHGFILAHCTEFTPSTMVEGLAQARLAMAHGARTMPSSKLH